jgi:hypothetical protein
MMPTAPAIEPPTRIAKSCVSPVSQFFRERSRNSALSSAV